MSRMRKHILGLALGNHRVATAAKIWFDSVHKRANADIAQLVEQVIRNDQVVGSNPTIGSSRNYLNAFSEQGGNVLTLRR
jgi:hypothetical protein